MHRQSPTLKVLDGLGRSLRANVVGDRGTFPLLVLCDWFPHDFNCASLSAKVGDGEFRAGAALTLRAIFYRRAAVSVFGFT